MSETDQDRADPAAPAPDAPSDAPTGVRRGRRRGRFGLWLLASVVLVVLALGFAGLALTGKALRLPVWAVADGFCGGGSTTFTIQAQTTGDVTQVGAQVTLANGTSKNVQLSGGGGTWSASAGPFPASAQMPDSSAISISVIARDAAGQQASASASSTLRKPSPC